MTQPQLVTTPETPEEARERLTRALDAAIEGLTDLLGPTIAETILSSRIARASGRVIRGPAP